ncbi:MAG TPA: flagellar hook-length control protein FliK, partial [Candidatus Sulfotelmatobacter sp.]|nr:flagellar hook-length control protein FliK [Candidatus Sulfotelmatobacter sp.]
DQIMEQVNLVKEKGKTELSLTLKPAELGEILLTMTAQQGTVSIQIQSNGKTKKLLDAHLTELAGALKKAHVQCDLIEITEVTKHA